MRKLARDNEPVAFIEAKMPNASLEQKLQASFEFWQFFDALWAIADRLVSEREGIAPARDKSVPFANVETPTNA